MQRKVVSMFKAGIPLQVLKVKQILSSVSDHWHWSRTPGSLHLSKHYTQDILWKNSLDYGKCLDVYSYTSGKLLFLPCPVQTYKGPAHEAQSYMRSVFPQEWEN